MNPPAPPRRLLLPVDGSPHTESAARYVAGYARMLGPSLAIMVNVRAPLAERSGGARAQPEIFDSARCILNDAGVACTWRDDPGDPAQTINRIAAEEQADEIVMGSRGLGQWKGLVLGSVAYKVLQQADVPVTIVGTSAQVASHLPDADGVHRILLAVDGSRHALRATEYVCRLRETGMPLEVELLTVVGPIPPGYLQEFITREKLDFYYQQEGDRALFEARAALETAGVKYNKHIVAGYVMDKLMHNALARKCTRIVIGSRGQGSMAGLALGSVAYQAIHLAPIPVTLVV